MFDENDVYDEIVEAHVRGESTTEQSQAQLEHRKQL